MTPKKAAIIALIVLIITAMFLAFLYIKKPAVAPADTGGPSQALTPQELMEQKIKDIVQKGQKDPAQYPPDKVRQEITDTVNAEIIKQEQNKTPAEKAADLKAQADRQKIIDQINSQILKKINSQDKK